jgi:putative peptidoglycan lipid II flippase
MGKTSIARSAGLVSACTLLSRVLGLVRDALCSHFFGAGLLWDAFAVAFRIPNLFRRLFGEGALTAAFLPAFVEQLDAGRRDAARELLQRLATALALLLGAAAAAGVAVTYFLPDDPKTALMAPLLRIMLPYLPLICVAALLGAALNGVRHYFAPAFAPVVLNVVLIAALLLCQGSVHAQAWAVVLGGVATLAVLLPPLFAHGFALRPRVGFGDPAFREVLRKFLPVVIGLAPVQINELVGSLVAQYAVPGEGAVSALYYGNQLVQLPLALVGTAVATVAFPMLASAKEDFGEVFRKSLRLVLFLSLPAAAGLMALAGPLVDLLFRHGRFDPGDAVRTSNVVFWYGLGLWAYGANQIQVRAFYARKDMLTPVRVSAAMVLLNLGLTLTLVGRLGERGIAIANSATGIASFLVLNHLLRRREAGLDLAPVRAFAAKALVASMLMAGAAWGAWRSTLRFEGAGIGPTLLRGLVPVAAGALAYFALAALLRMDEARTLLRRRPHDAA